ncbi:hypothetical protein R1flu_020045 [Riccia fluitans]|uniref:CBF1-interacting co-repressor CIR N-terminal domain-containing protein n=1 Tax=Riccia fluitans TaxID=41844 RepID=A0ABD1ZKD4_9MARC
MGGHGGLNILPQKRWNVHNFENREKVKRNEEEAAREEAIRQQKARREETEFKLEKLREAAKSKRRRVENESSPVQEAGDGALVVREILQVEESKATIALESTRRGKKKGTEGLGYGASSKSGKKPWYMVKSFMVDRTQREEEETSNSIVRIADGADKRPFRTPQQKLGGHSRPADDDGEFAADDCESRPAHDEEESRIPVGMKTTVKAKNPMDDLPEYFRLWD